MKYPTLLCALILATLTLLSCQSKSGKPMDQLYEYVPADKALYNEIVAMDKAFFDAYNNCDVVKQDSMFSEDIEFFHDQGGLVTSKADLLTALKENICGKVQRELIAGTIEVYPIPNFGAVQMGLHKFYNNQEPDAISKPNKFITIWKKETGKWKITKVISLH